MISLDKSILDLQSEAADRMKSYGTICDELHIIVIGGGGGETKSEENIFIYGAGGNRIAALMNAYQMGAKILQRGGKWIITSQEPFETGLAGWLLAKKSGTGLEVQLHGDFYGNDYWKKEKLINRLRWHLGKFILKRADGVRVVSERIKKSIGDFAKGMINEIPVCANLEEGGDAYFLKNEFPGAYPIILAVGNLVPVKNHKFLIEVFAEIKKELPHAKLVIVGDGPLLKDLRFKISDLRLEKDVELARYQKNLADYYSSADIFVHPSLYEGWGRAVVEAASFGMPIVMSDVGLAGEVIQDGISGIVVSVNNKELLKKAIIELSRDEALRARLAEGAREAFNRLPAKEHFLDMIKRGWEEICKNK